MELTKSTSESGMKSFAQGDTEYIIASTFHDDLTCEISITDGEICWKKSLKSTDIKSFAKETGMSNEEYISKMKLAFQEDSNIGGDVEIMEYEFNRSADGTLEFKWKTVQKDIKFCLGSILIEKVETGNGIMGMLTSASQELRMWKSMVFSTNEECTAIKKKYLQTVDLLSECTKLKQDQENELLTKFVLVINEKKAKIRKILKQNELYVDTIKQLQKQINSQPEVETQPSTSKQAVTLKNIREMSSSSETDDSYPIILKHKKPLLPPPKILPTSPIKPKDMPIEIPTGLSDVAVTTSSDSTVDINDMIDDM
uniref:DNA repair protein XRCC4-like n=1 Tax=Phallusia mammillata TaxID=59560 RepID=A0A6F9DWH7_9ASCI|nr:DNA repair protein XRCC4-like [Phallusia mammillata]